jgi:uncharacterized protein (TIGR02996 family)
VSDEPDYLSMVLANPEEAAPRFLLADWFEANGHPTRAHFVRRMCELAKYPEGSDHHRRLKEAARQLLAKCGPEWLGPRLAQYLEADSPDPMELRRWARHHSALPLMPDMAGCYCIRMEGEIISFAWDREEDARTGSETRVRNVVLFQGSEKYPELRLFIPPRPIDASDCPACEGKGVLMKLPAELRDKVVCECGGLGWIMPDR